MGVVLLCDHQVVILLPFLEQKILAVEEVGVRQRSGRIGQFLFVERETVSLNHLAGFALARENMRLLCQQIQGTDTGFEFVEGNLIGLYTVEDIEESGLV